MSDARDDRQRLTLVFLPAMLCNDELYRPQIEGIVTNPGIALKVSAGPSFRITL